jgi:NitT/TauT family transport system ATP-binding protein
MTDFPLVELAGVGKTYPNGAVALDGFSMALRQGEFVSLLGPSGCGKSTALRLIAGLTSPSTGVVRRAWEHSAKQNHGGPPLGCVFQEPTLLPWATVWKNAYLPLRLQGVRKAPAKEQVDEVLALVGLSDFANAYPRELSGGMKMRASVARALVTRPQLLMLDEPFAALDEITRNRLNDDLLSLWRQRRWAGLFITHSVFESVYLSTRVLVMTPRPGKVCEEIPIDLPEPRTVETRTSPRYMELCRRVSSALEQAAQPAAAGSVYA